MSLACRSPERIQSVVIARKRLNWTNTIVIGVVHVLAILAVVYLAAVQTSPWTLGLGALWALLCGLSITGGYHRLFSHAAYEASVPVRLLYLLFGAAAVQNSALKWAGDHRVHHARVDLEEDPYNITRGFWWAHIGWVLCKGDRVDSKITNDLSQDPLVRWQDRYYVLIAVMMGVVVPAALGSIWGDPVGAVLVAGFLRLALQWHGAFAVNSVAHTLGRRPYDRNSSARDSIVTALITLGEGYHNFHHRFKADYRNGVRWYHFDPTKWFVWSLSKVGLTRNLRRVTREVIDRARREAVATSS